MCTGYTARLVWNYSGILISLHMTRWQTIMQKCKYVFVYRQIAPFIINSQYILCTTPSIVCFSSYANSWAHPGTTTQTIAALWLRHLTAFQSASPKQLTIDFSPVPVSTCVCVLVVCSTHCECRSEYECVRGIHKVRILWGLICGCCRSSIYKWEIKMSTKLSPQTPQRRQAQTNAHTHTRTGSRHTHTQTYTYGDCTRTSGFCWSTKTAKSEHATKSECYCQRYHCTLQLLLPKTKEDKKKQQAQRLFWIPDICVWIRVCTRLYMPYVSTLLYEFLWRTEKCLKCCKGCKWYVLCGIHNINVDAVHGNVLMITQPHKTKKSVMIWVWGIWILGR